MPSAPAVTRELFGTTPDDEPVDNITLVNARGSELQVLNYGAIIRSLRVPDRDGAFDDVVLGFDHLADYVADRAFIGATVGRFANRIKHGRFVLDGHVYELPINDPPHHLHGGAKGFYKKLWRADVAEAPGAQAVTLSRTSRDGEEKYPGTLDVAARYSLTDDDELIVEYRAVTDRATPINLAQHSYFNLRGAGTIHAHELTIRAVGYLPTDETAIPLDHIEPVTDSPFGFTRAAAIGPRLSARDPQIVQAHGFDHCYVLRHEPGTICHAASLYESHTGRTLDVLTTEPGLQLYTGQYLPHARGKDGRDMGAYGGLCLETQHFPDSPNRPEFPSTILRPGEQYYSQTVFRFGVRR